MTWLLDTNVISEPAKSNPSPDVMRWMDAQPIETFFTTSLAFAEIRSGIDLVDDPRRKATLETWLEFKVRPFFAGRVLESDETFWSAMIRVLARAKENKRTLPASDMIFAAAAERYDLIVVTRNVKHFIGAGVRVLNPWMVQPKVEMV